MNPAEMWLIDGWNVLHGLSAVSRRAVLTPETLMASLADFAALSGHRLLVIWDGHGPGGDPRLKIPVSPSVEVLYSAGQTADAVLERYLFEHRLEASFAVVTDDGAMTRIARGSGARVFSVVRFREILEEARSDQRRKTDDSQADSHGFNRPFNKALDKFKKK